MSGGMIAANKWLAGTPTTEKGIESRVGLRLVNTKTFKSGVVALYYERLDKDNQ